MKIDRSVLLKELKERFPVIKEALNQEQGLLHFEIAVFRKFTNEQISKGDELTLLECFKLAEKAYLFGNSKVKDAIDVSFVEDLNFGANNEAWQLLPESLKALYISFHKRSGVPG